MTETKIKVLNILEEDCEVEDVSNGDTSLPLFSIEGLESEDWGLDSLQVLELIVAVDREFKVKLDDAPKTVWISLDTIVEYIDLDGQLPVVQ